MLVNTALIGFTAACQWEAGEWGAAPKSVQGFLMGLSRQRCPDATQVESPHPFQADPLPV